MNEYTLTRKATLFTALISVLIAFSAWNGIIPPLLSGILAGLGAGSLVVLWISQFGPANALALEERLRTANSWAIYCSVRKAEAHKIQLTSDKALNILTRLSTALDHCPLISCAAALITLDVWNASSGGIERQIYVSVTVLKNDKPAQLLIPYEEMLVQMDEQAPEYKSWL